MRCLYILITNIWKKSIHEELYKVHNNIKRMLLFKKEQDIKAKLVSVTTVVGVILFKRRPIITVTFTKTSSDKNITTL